MSWLKSRLWAVLGIFTAVLAAVTAIYRKGVSDTNTQRDADEMRNAYNNERQRNEIEDSVSRSNNSRDSLYKHWKRD